ncbi:MAG: alkaline phosphatase [Rhodobacter sp.]|nr:alkaline phosphatase [Rhodobacter sp.]
MKNITAFSLLALAAANASFAQDMVPQASSQWYIDGQAAVERLLAREPNTNTAKNVILLIADGNGVGTNYATRMFDGQQKGGFGDENVLPYEAFPYLALVKTYNINASTPDSAPTAASMNTGVKQRFNLLNLGENAITKDCTTEAGNELTTFAEIVTEAGKSVGIVSTARLTHATPAAVYAKTAYRNWEDAVPDGCDTSRDIAMQLFDSMQSGVIDFAMGGGRRHFAPDGAALDEGGKGRRKDGRDLIAEAQAAGAQYAWNTETAMALNLDGSTPILALLEDSHMKYEADRDDSDEPSLADMTKMAIEYLSHNEDGYFLEIEAGRVDHANHDGNLARTVRDGVAFAEAVAMADAMTDDADTLIIVTADHDHAISFNGYCGRGTPITGLCMGVDNEGIGHNGEPELASDGRPYTVVGYLNGAGSVLREDMNWAGVRPNLTQEEAMDIDYLQQALIPRSSETHSPVDVALYAKGPWAHLFDGTIEQNVIFHVMQHAVSAR